MVRNLASQEEWNNIIQDNRVVVVDCYTDWCLPCRFYGITFEGVAKMFEGKALFIRVNVGEHSFIIEKYNLTVVPTTLIIVNGELKEFVEGSMKAEELVKLVNKYV